jgi:CzcA family heavy metal efflux pump
VLQVIYEASSEIRNSIVLATVIVVLVFVPLFALSGVEGRIFTPIGIAYVTSLLASLVVSLSLTPVLCYYLLPKAKLMEKKEGWIIRSVKWVDRKILERVLEHPLKVIASCVLLIGIAVSALPYFGQNFLPPFNEGSAMAVVVVRSGISLEASSKMAMDIDLALQKIPEVKSVGRRTGRADEDSHAAGVNQSEFEIALSPSERTRDEVFADIRRAIKSKVPQDAYISVSQPVTHRLDHVMSGVKSQVAIKLFGPDLRLLRQNVAEIRNSIKGIEGIVDLQIEGQVLFPQYKIFMMREDLAKYGILPGHLIKDLEAMLQGVVVGRIIRSDRYYDVYVRLDEDSRDDIDSIRKIPVFVTPTGRVVTLNEVADIFETSGPNFIEREQLYRRIVVSFNVVGKDLESVVLDVQRTLREKVELPEGYHIEFGGRYESQKKASRMVFILGSLSMLGIFLVLYANFRSSMLALQIMVNVPLALVGSVAAVWFTDRTFSVATLIAFVTLCGIASRNGILMVSHYIHLMKHEGEKFSKEMVIRGSLERLIPVLMTAFSAVLALIPLVLAKDQPGKEILHPVAVVIVGGLLSSTLLDIFVTPVIFYRFGRKAAERMIHQGEECLVKVSDS